MPDNIEMVDVFERLAERTYGEETPGSDMTTIQRWHFTSQIGIGESEYDAMVEEAKEWIANAETDFDEPNKIQAGFGLFTLAEAQKQANEAEPGTPHDPTFY